MPASASDGYVEGVVTAPPGTRLDQLKVQLFEPQSIFGEDPVPVGPDGRYRIPFDWLVYANLKVLAGDTGLADTWYGNVTKQELTPSLAVNRRSIRSVDVSMVPGSAISGRITVPGGYDSGQLSVVADRKFISPSRAEETVTVRKATVAPDGTYRIPGLGADNYTVRVQPGASGLLETWYGSGPDRAAATLVAVAAQSEKTGIDLPLTEPARVSGTAIFPPGSTPEYGYIRLYSEQGNLVTQGNFDPDGSFDLQGLPSGTYRINFGSDWSGGLASTWYPDASEMALGEKLTLAPGESRSGLTLSLLPEGRISGTVIGAKTHVRVHLIDSLGRIVSETVTGPAGGYTLGRVGAGTFKVRFSESGIGQSPSTVPQFYPGIPESAGFQAGMDVTVVPGQVTSGVNTVLTTGGVISGTVLDEVGQPLESHSVNTVSLDGPVEERRGLTDREGKFSIPGLADGDYIVETNFAPNYSIFRLGHLYSGNVRDRAKAQTLSIRNGQPVDAGTLSYATAGTTPTAAAGKFVPLTPTRILDTRQTPGPVPAGTNLIVDVGGKAGIPADAGAVAVNITVTEPPLYGVVTAFPFGTLNSGTSNINYGYHATVPNHAVVPVKDGKIMLGNEGYGTAHLIVDVAGYFTSGIPTDNGAYQPVSPFRAGDSRQGGGGTLGGQQFTVPVAGQGGLPAEVGAVVVNLTAARTQVGGASTTYGYLTAFASGSSRPATSNVNYDWTIGDTPNLAVVPVGSDGKITIENTSHGPVGVVVDVMGYFLKGTATAAGTFQHMAPTRFLDSRSNPTPVGPGKDISVAVAGVKGVPSGAKAAMINLTATEAQYYGFLTAYPAGQTPPNASNVNYLQRQTVANFAVVPIGADGKITIHNTSYGTVQVVVDVMGYVMG